MLDSSNPNLHNHLNNKALFLSLRDPNPRPLMLPIFWGSPYKKRGKEKKYKKIIGRKQKKTRENKERKRKNNGKTDEKDRQKNER
jgi:hypothetical protein